ncbi:MAG: acyltransferase [Oscillospiraceae bacterium]|nr:acyltransferase [Oscillospiraceae bacterium]
MKPVTILTDRQTELNNCTFVKTILMVLVVFYHSILFWAENWFTGDPAFSAPLLKYVSGWLNTVHIQGFALVSGYLFSYLKYEREKYGKFLPFVANKAKRLLIPFLFAAVVWVLPIQFFFYQPDGLTIIKNYVLAIGPAQLWFLVMLFGVFVIFWPLSDFFYKKDLLGAVAVLGMYGCGWIGSRVVPNVFQVWTALRYMPLFFLGFKLRQYGTASIRKLPAALWLVVSIALYCITLWLEGQGSMLCKLAAIGFAFLTNVVGAVMAFVVLQKIGEKVKWNKPHFSFVSKRSMVVYLFHQQVVYFLIYWFNGILNPYLHAAVNFVVSMAISLGIATVLLRFKSTSFLVGEK